MLYDKWWKESGKSVGSSGIPGGMFGEGKECKKRRSSADNMANALGVVNIGGIFVVLLCGLAFAITIAIIEFCWKTSSLNAWSGGDNTIMQTSPNQRNTRRRSTTLKVRTRASLCAEIAGTLIPYFTYSNKTNSCVRRQKESKNRHNEHKSSAYNSRNQTIECNMFEIPQNRDTNEDDIIDENLKVEYPLNGPRQAPDPNSYQDKVIPGKECSSHSKPLNGILYDNTYDNVPNHCRVHDVPSDEDNYFYQPSSTNKYQDQYTSTKKLKKNLNHSLPSIPPAVPPHANEDNLDQISARRRVYVPSLDRYFSFYNVDFPKYSKNIDILYRLPDSIF